MLHRTFDYYEFIAVTVTLETGQKLINLLEADHALRQYCREPLRSIHSFILEYKTPGQPGIPVGASPSPSAPPPPTSASEVRRK
jgi:hypothetical protein